MGARKAALSFFAYHDARASYFRYLMKGADKVIGVLA